MAVRRGGREIGQVQGAAEVAQGAPDAIVHEGAGCVGHGRPSRATNGQQTSGRNEKGRISKCEGRNGGR